MLCSALCTVLGVGCLAGTYVNDAGSRHASALNPLLLVDVKRG